MMRTLQLHLDDSYRLDITQDGEGAHTMTLMEYDKQRKGYVIVEAIEVYEAQEMYDLLYEAYRGDLSIWTNQYVVSLDIDNDNEPMLSLIIDNDVDNLTIRGKDNDDT